jgi:two-component system NtrC family sensor kinase
VQGLKLRETNIFRIIQDSIASLTKQDSVEISVLSHLQNEAVWVDHEQMVNALVNLEENAIEAMPNGGRLTITVEDSESNIFITVQDTGAGIAQENMAQLFTPFFTTKPPGEGTGLGLSETYGIVKAHRGNISIESNNDPLIGAPGTKVSLLLPRRMIMQNKEMKIILHDNE